MTQREPTVGEQVATMGMVIQGEQMLNRQQIVTVASRIVDTLNGNAPDGQTVQIIIGSDDQITSAPKGIPRLGYEGALGDGKVHMMGDLGDYYTHLWSNERPATTFNTAFYAGVLAAKAGLVDVELFHHDSEIDQ